MRASEGDLLILLASRGALSKSVPLTTIGISKELKTSQQTASRWVLELEKGGYLCKEGRGIRLTAKGKDHLKGIHSALESSFSKKKGPISLEGEVINGFKEAQFYLSIPQYAEQLEKGLGFKPFPGTLNLRLKSAEDVSAIGSLKNGIFIDSFEHEGREYGGVECFPCRVNDLEECAIILPKRTHYGPNVLQLISPQNLRKRLKLKSGDSVSVSL